MIFGATARASFDIRGVDLEGRLSEADWHRLDTQMHPFVFTILQFLLIEKIQTGKLRLPPEELGRSFGQAVVFGYHDAGYPAEEAVHASENVLKAIDDYTDSLDKVSESELDTKGPFFFLCQHFVGSFIPDFAPRDELQREKHFLAFDVANQAYKNTREGFEAAYKKVKLTFQEMHTNR